MAVASNADGAHQPEPLSASRASFAWRLLPGDCCLATLACMVVSDNLHAGTRPADVGNQHLHRRHHPEETLPYPLIEAHLDAFLEHLRERDSPLPCVVIDEFKECLRCGLL